jgi:hypothetical protein
VEPKPDPAAASTPLQQRLLELGEALRASLGAVVGGFPPEAARTAGLSRHAGVNKVFASRLLSALRQDDPLAVVHKLPGPEPLRRFLLGLAEDRVDLAVQRQALAAVDAFDRLIEAEAGDRSALQAIMTPWLDEARQEFTLRRRQAAFKAVSELKGAAVDLHLSTVLLHPSEDPAFLDVVWAMALVGVQRLSPGAQVRLDTRRLSDEGQERRTRTLLGEELGALLPGGLEAFCPHGPAALEAREQAGTMNYLLAGDAFGPRSRCDMLIAELNRGELRRFRHDQPDRRSFVYGTPLPPAQDLVLDLLIHKSVLDREPPELLVYDTAGSGPHDPNDPVSAYDLMAVEEEPEHRDLAEGLLPLEAYPRYADWIGALLGRLDWLAADFHQWRVRMAYPLHSSQITLAYKPRPA